MTENDPGLAEVAAAECAEADVPGQPPEVTGEIRSGKLAGRSMWSSICVLALPILIQQMMAACVGLVDTILGGQLPRHMVVPALDAIGIGSYITWFVGIAM